MAEVNEHLAYSLRPAKTADYDFLYGLIVATMKEYVAAIWGWDETFQRQRFADHFNPAKSKIIVHDGRDVGQLSVIQGEDELFLSAIFILPEFQRRGLGTAIIGDILLEAQTKGLPVRLQVLKGNPARLLYERLGFKVVEEQDVRFVMKHAA